MAGYDLVQIDDIRHALKSVMEFYDKELDDRTWKFWWSVLKKLPYHAVRKALAEYLSEGKYAPKPAHIVDIAKRYGTAKPVEHAPPVKRADEEIERAWMWYLAKNSEGTGMAVFQDALADMTPELEERYIHIVNHEAKQANMPTAINPEHRLREVWG